MKGKSQSRKQNADSSGCPLLLIGWGREGLKDITFARNAFPCDKGIDCVDAKDATKDEVLKEIEGWLKGNLNAQILYIGSHAGPEGLFPIRKAKTKISWSCLGAVLSTAITSIWVCIGGCSSSVVATHWSGSPGLPVDVIIGFSERIRTREAMDLLAELIKTSNVLGPGSRPEERELTSLTEDIVEMRQTVPQITVHYKVPNKGYVDSDKFGQTVGTNLSKYLDNKAETGAVKQLSYDVLSGMLSPDKITRKAKATEKLPSLNERLLLRKIGIKKKSRR